MLRFFVMLSLAAILFNSCQSDTKVIETKNKKVKHRLLAKLLAPKNNQSFKLGDSVIIHIEAKDLVDLDSVVVLYGKKKLGVSHQLPFKTTIPKDQLSCGKHNVEYNLYPKEGNKEVKFASIKVLADQKPKQYSFVKLASFPHDIHAYTQGLEWDDEVLYEGTGQIGQSSLRKVDVKNGEILQKIDLPETVFGEGITIDNKFIYQLSWKAQTGFIYDKQTLELTKTFSYNTDGWGLCHNDEHLIMSDGSEKLYFLNKETFKVEKVIQVYDDQNPLLNLNELEYVDGLIYANVYQSMIIATIDPNTGAVISYTSMRGILDEADIHDDIDVLNGIAYKASSKTFFVTGKNWPKMFEIRFTEN